MVEDFLKQYADLIAQYPEKIVIKRTKIDENFYEITILADKIDTGRLIGKDGKMINAIKTILIGCKAKEPVSYRITVEAINE